ncbi:MAG: hypothetical protein ACNA7W_03590 [Pseudomonadales bacterium]
MIVLLPAIPGDDRRPQGTADGAAENRLVAPTEFAANDRTDRSAHAGANGRAHMIVIGPNRQGRSREQKSNQGHAQHDGHPRCG